MTELTTFTLPEAVTGSHADHQLGRKLIEAWRTDGIFQVGTHDEQDQKVQRAMAASKAFFKQPRQDKSRWVSELTYAGYVASGEEVTAGEQDQSEIFTLCKDLPLDDQRVKDGWPCHGPVPWPNDEYRDSMKALLAELDVTGEKLLKLVALGLELEINALTALSRDGWHHMRVLRFPASSAHTHRGIGAHTDYGMLVIATQDEVGGLYIRPPVEGEQRKRNWLPGESTAGLFENDEPWTFVKPVPRVFTVFPGDILQFMTHGYLLSTPHKVTLNTRERFAMAYFHEPAFNASARPLLDPLNGERIHYGTHFTNMFMRCYPERVTTERIKLQDRLRHLEKG
ncbi:2-oxoglutarate and iron-dependent oxygenase domain-containing protein [Pseudomonas asgharzadehiana]|uniref:2-oxoglutarate-dependent ethylene/succinate-forming enzyme n=1 Tax=Pseudomonas asgharzadehiana TaxID=2842349 RepID=A0ABX8NUF7_9PSED|nr:2-oxoglutarate and iron-dependent oxygenase domain-containing protein [Pseudomonas asgharzadehiana]QXH65137.1 MFS transporter [Pseudomonas asgharzadehiana]